MTMRAIEHTLWILRHAKSDWGEPALEDAERPLAKRGRKEARRMGAWFADSGKVPDAILCSPARRAVETIQRFCEAAGLPQGRVEYHPQLYLATLDTLSALLHTLPEQSGGVMVVGHNPGLEELLLWLCGGEVPRTESGKVLTTANLAEIRLAVPWAELAAGGGTLHRLSRPKSL